MTERRHRVEKKHWSEILKENGACADGVRFARKFRTLQEAWDACAETDWMFWLMRQVKGQHRIPTTQLHRLRKSLRGIHCWTCKTMLGRVTWQGVFEDLADHSRIDAAAFRAIFPNPPRFRNGAGE